MREAKVGAWWEDNKQRALANNSVAYTEKPDAETFLEEWHSLVKSKSGERGIFNRVAAQAQAAKSGRRALEQGTVTLELEDGTKKVLDATDEVQTKFGKKFAYQLTEQDELLSIPSD